MKDTTIRPMYLPQPEPEPDARLVREEQVEALDPLGAARGQPLHLVQVTRPAGTTRKQQETLDNARMVQL